MPSGLRYGVEVRRAVAADGPELARLLGQAGAAVTAAEAVDRLDAVRNGAVLVTAGYSGLNGLVALHWAPVLHLPRPVAQMTMLVVDEDERRHGIGRMLLKAASQAARLAGCDELEVAAGEGQAALVAFCRAAGFGEGGVVFGRFLRKRGVEG